MIHESRTATGGGPPRLALCPLLRAYGSHLKAQEVFSSEASSRFMPSELVTLG